MDLVVDSGLYVVILSLSKANGEESASSFDLALNPALRL